MILDASNSGPLFAFNDGEAKIALTSRRCNIATLRRRDVVLVDRYPTSCQGHRLVSVHVAEISW